MSFAIKWGQLFSTPDPRLIQFQSAPNWQRFNVLWMFGNNSNKLNLDATWFTYDIDFHEDLVGLLLVLLVACSWFRWRWKVNFPLTGRRSLLKWALRQRDAAMLAGWRLLCWVGSCLRLTAFVTRGRRFFTLLQVTASISRLVACLIDWRKSKIVSQLPSSRAVFFLRNRWNKMQFQFK